MAHDHSHDGETYYLDQLCLIAVCGAFAAAAITLYFWQKSILVYMFGTDSMFHDLVLWSGISLLVLVVVRAVALWISVGRAAHAGGACGHVHVHVHEHAHEHLGGHDHGYSHTHDGGHTHGHEHPHTHDCGHDHSHEHEGHTHAAPSCGDGHEHGFAPWQYVVLLVPIILFLLGLPNQGPKARAHDVSVSQADPQAAPAYASLIGAGPLPLQQLVLAAAIGADPAPQGMDFKSLESAAQDEQARRYWTGKNVKVVGQFAPSVRDNRSFSLVRFRIQCCGADAVAYPIPARCSESLAGLQQSQWIEVSGRVHFQPHPNGGGYMTVLLVPRRQNIVRTDPDPSPYIQ